MPNFIMQALLKQEITRYGDGSQTRAFCFITDLIEGLLSMMEAGDDVQGPVNLGNPHEISLRELATRIIALTGSRSQIVHRPCRRTTRCSAARTSAWLGVCCIGSQPCPSMRV